MGANLNLATRIPWKAWSAIHRLTQLPGHTTRLAPGSAPGQLATAAPAVEIPNTYTFTPGTECQLWLQSRNAKGQSEPGPVTDWVAG